MKYLPTSVEPVNETASTSLCLPKASPTSPYPGKIFKTPSGIPASWAYLAILIAVSGVSSAGLIITEQPAAKAGAIFHTAIIKGKFQGTTPATTPIGSLTIKLVIDGSVAATLPKTLSINSPYHWKCIGASFATSLIQSAINFPESTHSNTEFSSPFFLNNSANFNKTSFLCSGVVRDHTPLLNAFLEALTARSTSL